MELIYLCFGTKEHKIDAKTLGVCLVESASAIEQIGLHQKQPFGIGMRVTALEPGSFEVPVDFYPLLAGTLNFAGQWGTVLRSSIKTLVEFMNLKNALKGSPPASVSIDNNVASIIATNGASINVSIQTLNLFTKSSELGRAIERQFEELDQNKSVEEFAIKDKKKRKVFHCNHSEFENMSKHTPAASPETKSKVVPAELCIQKPVLEKRQASWRFIHKGDAVSAAMKDEAFLERVAQGEKFAMGDRLIVDMKVEEEIDPDLQVPRITKREIVKVRNHIPRPSHDQTEFEFDGDD